MYIAIGDSFTSIWFYGNHLSCTVVRGSGHIGIIRGETAVVHWLKVAKHGVLGGWLVEVPQLQKQRGIKKTEIRIK